MGQNHERVRAQLRAACLVGDTEKVEALLRLEEAAWYWPRCLRAARSRPAQPDPQVVLGILSAAFPDDGNNTLLHYLCCGTPLGSLGRLLWVSSGGAPEVLPARHDELRAQLLAWLLARHPGLLALACSRNAAGRTPLHCCLGSGSLETLQVLVGALRLLSLASQRIVLSVPGPGAGSPLDMALQAQQWEAVQLLARAGGHLLSHDFLAASQQVARLINPRALASGGGQGSKAAAGGAGGLARTVQGAVSGVQSYLGRLFDWVSGQAQEREVVLRHQTQQAQQTQHAVGSRREHMGGSSHGAGAGSRGDGRQAPASAVAAEGVLVLQGTAEVQRLRREQIDSTAYVLGVSAPEAAALLAEHGWDELAAVQSRLGSAGVEGGAGPAGREGAGLVSGPAEPPAAPACVVEGAFTEPGAAGAVGLAAVLDVAHHPPEQSAAYEVSGHRATAHVSSSSSRGGDPHWTAPTGLGLTSSGTPATTQAPSNPGVVNGGSDDSAQATGQCIVCYERCGASGTWRGLPCGHHTCDACWNGILLAQLDTGEVHRVVCPEPGCGMPLPLEAAEGLLPRKQYRRYQELMAQSYVDSNPDLRWCPRPGCGSVVRLVGGAAPAGQRSSPAAVSVQCACGHSFCWACSSDAHEPATCEQMRRWEAELAALRDASSSQDQQWLARNTKRCPACTAPIEKHGGCNHMTCRACRHQWCWECGRNWGEHTAETGGYYHCILQRRSDLPDFEQPSSQLGAFGWLRDVWGVLQTMAAQHALEQQLRHFLRHDFNPAQLTTLAMHTQRLLLALGVCGRPGEPSRPASTTAAAPAPAPAPASAAGSGPWEGGPSPATAWGGLGTTLELGPETLLGLSFGEAAGMRREEWGQLVTAAAESLAASGQLSAAPEAPPSGSAADAAAARAAPGWQPAGACSSVACADLARLARQVAAAHGALQHAAVAAWALRGFGPRRRFLDRLCKGIEARVGRLESLLMAMPDRQAALQCQQHFKAPGVWAAGSRHIASLLRRLLHSLYGVSPPHLRPGEQRQQPILAAAPATCLCFGQPCSPDAQQQQQLEERLRLQDGLSRGLTGEQLRRQALFALAVHQQGRHLRSELGALDAAVSELLQAGRVGLFASS